MTGVQTCALPISPDQARRRIQKALAAEPPGPEVALVRNLNAGGVPARLYHPSPAYAAPVLVYFHGGGWVINSVDTHDSVCRFIASHSGCCLISIEYRLAPEHRYPAAFDDAWAATRWIYEHTGELNVDRSRFAVGGDSAGGALATAVALRARDSRDLDIQFQLLIYPITDYHTPARQSYVQYAEGYALESEGMKWFWGHYLPPGVDLNDRFL